MATSTLFREIILREESAERLREALDRPELVLESRIDVEKNLEEGLRLLRAAFKIKESTETIEPDNKE